MPVPVEKCVSRLLPNLKRDNPTKSDSVLTRMAFAICQDQYNKRKKKGSKESMSDQLSLRWNSKMVVFNTLTEAMEGIDRENCEITMLHDAKIILESEVPKPSYVMTEQIDTTTVAHTSGSQVTLDGLGGININTEDVEESGAQVLSPHIFIRGTAIGEGVTRNLNEYLPEELRRAAPTLADVPLQIDHGRKVSDNAGRVLVASFDPKSKSIDYVARLRRNKTEAFEAVEHGDVNSVSIGADIDDVKCNVCDESKLTGNCNHVVGREYEGEIATRIGVGLEFFELSVTPFGAYQGADIAGVVSHSTNLDDAIASFTESWKKKFGEQTQMSDPVEKDQTAELELAEAQKQLTEEKETNQELVEQVKDTLARTIAESELEMGQRKQDDLNKRVGSLKENSVDALKLLSDSTSERLSIFRRDNRADSRDRGIVSDDDESNDPMVVEREELKDFLREEMLGWPKPSATGKANAKAYRKNTYHPMYVEYAKREQGGK